MARVLILCLALASLPLAALAQDESTQTIRNREDWLRYANWERRRAPRLTGEDKSKSNSTLAAPAGSSGKQEPARVILPERPGSQTVEGVQPTIPGWAFQQPIEPARPPEIFLGSYCPRTPIIFGQGGNFNYSWQGGYRPAGLPAYWGGRPGVLTPGQYLPGRFLSGPFLQAYPQSRLGPEVIETGPSPASGNYYQPIFSDRGVGHYYESGSPWQIPLSAPVNPKDYWGPQGSPFKQKVF
jgi:hypothetical protein